MSNNCLIIFINKLAILFELLDDKRDCGFYICKVNNSNFNFRKQKTNQTTLLRENLLKIRIKPKIAHLFQIYNWRIFLSTLPFLRVWISFFLLLAHLLVTGVPFFETSDTLHQFNFNREVHSITVVIDCMLIQATTTSKSHRIEVEWRKWSCINKQITYSIRYIKYWFTANAERINFLRSDDDSGIFVPSMIAE